MKSTSQLITPKSLNSILNNKNLVLIDARSGQRDQYLSSHIQGALFVDLNEDLSDIKNDFAEGGRHPLPSIKQFVDLLGKLGIGPESEGVAYDDKNGANAASRFWWMMKAIGHENVRVLNGGLQAAIEEEINMSSNEESAKKVDEYPVDAWKLPMVSIEDIDKHYQDKDCLIIDVRSPDRYNGVHEPIDLIAGHIPDAVNIPFASNLDEDGNFLTPEQLKEKYTEAVDGRSAEQVIVHCGSGVTACHSILAMAEAGMELPKLYVGSWSEWSRNDREMILGDK